MTIIAQITDLHVQAGTERAYKVVNTNQLVENAIAHLNSLKPQPDVVVATGDLVHHGTVAEYEQLRDILAILNYPIYLLPGNHDDRLALKQVFSDHTYWPNDQEHLSYVVDDYSVRMVMMDTTIPGEGGGRMDGDRLSWISENLSAAPDKPTMVFMHHPPFPTGISMMDKIGLEGRDELAALVVQHPQVERVSCGHLHRGIACKWAGTVATTQPSLVHQVVLDVNPDSVGRFIMEPPTYQLHIWNGCDLVSHTVVLGEFDGPYHFADGQKEEALSTQIH